MYRNNQVPGKRRIIVIEEPTPLPGFLKSLSLFCQRHALPVPMTYEETSVSRSGGPVAVYRCGDRHCEYREGWAADFESGRPRRLWQGTRPQHRAGGIPDFMLGHLGRK